MSILEMYEKEGSPAHIWGWQPCLQKYFFLRRNSYVIFFAYRDFMQKVGLAARGWQGWNRGGGPCGWKGVQEQSILGGSVFRTLRRAHNLQVIGKVSSRVDVRIYVSSKRVTGLSSLRKHRRPPRLDDNHINFWDLQGNQYVIQFRVSGLVCKK
jgi:hypothetical protein